MPPPPWVDMVMIMTMIKKIMLRINMMMRMGLDDFGQSVHDIATNYIDTDLEVSGSSFKENVTEGNKQTYNVN